MSVFKAKKLLLILQMNEILFYLRDTKTQITNPNVKNISVNFHDTYNNYKISHRLGRSEFLSRMFLNMKNDIDVALWSNFNSTLTNDLAHKYFTRYFRDLLFVMATNRAPYGTHSNEASIRVRKDLSPVYNRFSGYNETNTIVVTTQQNLIEVHQRNDLIIPRYTPFNDFFKADPGIIPLVQYIQGLLLIKDESGIYDIRRFIKAKEAENIFKRASHNAFIQHKYL